MSANSTASRPGTGHKHADTLAAHDFSPADIPSQEGKTIVITGGDGGLGKQSARVLAAAGASVIIACRNLERAKAALDEISSVASGAKPSLAHLNLGDLSSVRACAEEIAEHTDSIDVLINNAGLMAVPYKETDDGFESQIGVNHLGHFALTGLLLPRLLSASSSRVVTVSSIMHHQGKLDVDDLNFKRRKYLRINAYVQSKVANMLFAAELARRAEAVDVPLTSVAVHPGAAATDLFDPIVPTMGLRRMVRQIIALTAASVEEGAHSTLYAATMPDVRNNDFLGPTEFGGVKGPVSRCHRSRDADDRELARALWEKSVELTGVDFAELNK